MHYKGDQKSDQGLNATHHNIGGVHLHYKAKVTSKIHAMNTLDQDEKRKRYKAHSKERDILTVEWASRGYMPPFPAYPDMPEDLKDLRCGAKTRAGTPCKLNSLYGNGRCKYHGGLSTGAKTKEGKAKVAKNGFKRGGGINKAHVVLRIVDYQSSH